jgi:hypothetical protein
MFDKDTDGSPRQMKYIMGRRNWCIVRWDQKTQSLLYDIRVEKEKGGGETVRSVQRFQHLPSGLLRGLNGSYPLISPPPRWQRELDLSNLRI